MSAVAARPPNREQIRIAARSFKQDPHPVLDRWRASAPMVQVPAPLVGRAWVLSRHPDVVALLKDPRLVKDRTNVDGRDPTDPLAVPDGGRPIRRRGSGGPLAPLLTGMLDRDDPDHARLRRLAQAAFTPRRIELLAGRIGQIADGLLDGLARQGRFDLIGAYALPLPVVVISEMLGVPEAERAWVVRGSKALIALGQAPWSMALALPSVLVFMQRIRSLIARRRADPGDDVLSALIAAQDGGGALDDDELLAMVVLLLSAGHETTTNLIGNGVAALLAHPQARDQLVADRSLAAPAIEELLRFAPPVETTTFRYARADIEVAGTLVRRGEAVLGLIGSANRDETVFDRPHQLDLARTPNRHLTFGMGGHYCLGAPLARLEGAIAIPALLERFPRLRLADPSGGLRWRPGLVLRGLERLPVRID